MPSIASPEGAVLLAYAACLLFLLVFSLGQLHLLLIHRRSRGEDRGAAPDLHPSAAAFPRVTIQLPVYNERYVVRRLLHAAAAIEYPAGRVDIQLLDDSTDETAEIAAEAIRLLRAGGTDVTHVRRGTREGYKAGALAHGLTLARGDLVAVFDADFVPPPDFLRRTVPRFADPRVGAVQARWDHLNRPQSAITRIQAFLLDLHFGLEQPARHRGGLFLNFNGTAGVWRTSAIAAAGGWSARTLTEDIDLSYRAQMAGWKLVYLDDCPCPGELPADMTGLRSQQYRWLKGGAQNARLHLARVARGGLSPRVRHHAAQHLLAGSAYVAILGALLLSVPLAALKNTSIRTDYVDYGIPFFGSTLALFAVFHGAQRPPPRGLAANLRFVGAMLAFLAFTMGLSVHNGRAVLSGWLGRGSEFVRTPKFGGGGWWQTAYAGRRVDRRIVPELLVLGLLLAGLAVGWRRREFALFPLQLMASAGLVWIVALSILHPLRARRHATHAARGRDAPLATQEAAA